MYACSYFVKECDCRVTANVTKFFGRYRTTKSVLSEQCRSSHYRADEGSNIILCFVLLLVFRCSVEEKKLESADFELR